MANRAGTSNGKCSRADPDRGTKRKGGKQDAVVKRVYVPKTLTLANVTSNKCHQLRMQSGMIEEITQQELDNLMKPYETNVLNTKESYGYIKAVSNKICQPFMCLKFTNQITEFKDLEGSRKKLLELLVKKSERKKSAKEIKDENKYSTSEDNTNPEQDQSESSNESFRVSNIKKAYHLKGTNKNYGDVAWKGKQSSVKALMNADTLDEFVKSNKLKEADKAFIQKLMIQFVNHLKTNDVMSDTGEIDSTKTEFIGPNETKNKFFLIDSVRPKKRLSRTRNEIDRNEEAVKEKGNASVEEILSESVSQKGQISPVVDSSPLSLDTISGINQEDQQDEMKGIEVVDDEQINTVPQPSHHQIVTISGENEEEVDDEEIDQMIESEATVQLTESVPQEDKVNLVVESSSPLSVASSSDDNQNGSEEEEKGEKVFAQDEQTKLQLESSPLLDVTSTSANQDENETAINSSSFKMIQTRASLEQKNLDSISSIQTNKDNVVLDELPNKECSQLAKSSSCTVIVSTSSDQSPIGQVLTSENMFAATPTGTDLDGKSGEFDKTGVSPPSNQLFTAKTAMEQSGQVSDIEMNPFEPTSNSTNEPIQKGNGDKQIAQRQVEPENHNYPNPTATSATLPGSASSSGSDTITMSYTKLDHEAILLALTYDTSLPLNMQKEDEVEMMIDWNQYVEPHHAQVQESAKLSQLSKQPESSAKSIQAPVVSLSNELQPSGPHPVITTQTQNPLVSECTSPKVCMVDKSTQCGHSMLCQPSTSTSIGRHAPGQLKRKAIEMHAKPLRPTTKGKKLRKSTTTTTTQPCRSLNNNRSNPAGLYQHHNGPLPQAPVVSANYLPAPSTVATQYVIVYEGKDIPMPNMSC